MKTRPRKLIASALLLVLLASNWSGVLHLGHSHDNATISSDRCVLCSVVLSPALSNDDAPAVAQVELPKRISITLPFVPSQLCWRLPTSPRSPPTV